MCTKRRKIYIHFVRRAKRERRRIEIFAPTYISVCETRNNSIKK